MEAEGGHQFQFQGTNIQHLPQSVAGVTLGEGEWCRERKGNGVGGRKGDGGRREMVEEGGWWDGGGRGMVKEGGWWRGWEGDGGRGGRGMVEVISPNILGVSFRFQQNYNFMLLNSNRSLNLRVVC